MSKFYRSRTDKRLIGVCGGIAESLNISSTLVRVITVILAWINLPLTALIYLIVGIVTPMEPYDSEKIRQSQKETFKIYPYFQPKANQREKAEKVDLDEE